MMKKFFLSAVAVVSLVAAAQDYSIVFTRADNPDTNLVRSFQYRPTADGYIESVNGNNRYTRALYGGHSLWRLETSDRPVFGAYHKKQNRNISFYITVGGRRTNLTDVARCVSRYRGGERDYILTDPSWGRGTLTLKTVARHDAEGAVWQIVSKDMPKDAELTAECSGTVNVRLNRSGDLGPDPKNAFDPNPGLTDLKTCTVKAGGNGTRYILYEDRDVIAANQSALKKIFDKAVADMTALTSRLVINTPDPFINTLGANLMAAGDGIWDGETYQHGAVGWRMPLAGWRGAYTGDFLGQHDRARVHFDAYAASQVTDVPPVFDHPRQDSTLAMARAEKRWGTPMYSNGYICRNPRRNDQMHHYDMNLCYNDELLWHLRWTGDTAYMRRIWPVLKASLAWEKRNYDPDDDGLYDAYCCIWASDALYYSGGAVTHSSAYNYRANRLAAQVAQKIGEDPTPYQREADKIQRAINEVLWMPQMGTWAEFKDALGYRRLHDHPGLWTIYHAIDSDVSTPGQYFQATGYIDNHIPHFPIMVDGDSTGIDGAFVLSTTDWMPYAWSINNVAHAETLHTALAYWLARRPDAAYRIFKGMVLDGMYLGDSPGNIGQISYYDAARGENYRDFADPVGVMSRALVQGLFGFDPDLINSRVTITPGFPRAWDHASIDHSDFSYSYCLKGRQAVYNVNVKMNGVDSVTLNLPMLYDKVEGVKLDGKKAAWTTTGGNLAPEYVTIVIPAGKQKVTVDWDGDKVDEPVPPMAASRPAPFTPGQLGLDQMTGDYEPVDIAASFNSSVTDIFHNRYESPRPATTTLRIPVNGIGEWCHPLDSANIDDTLMRNRALAAGGVIDIDGVPFLTPVEGDNIVYTSLFDNYPDSVTVPLTGRGNGLELLMAGSTNHIQCFMENGVVTVEYTDGSVDRMPLIPPYNWCPIEQEYYYDNVAFRVDTPRPLRYAFGYNRASRNLGDALEITGVYGRRIDGGAATVLCMPVNPDKELKSLQLKAISNDVVIGLMAVTLVKNGRVVPAPMPDNNGVVDNTPDSIAQALTARPAPGSTRRGNNPVLFLVGNSTMRTGTRGNGDGGQWGWGYYMQQYFDPAKITVENQALGGMSTRTFYTKLWPEIRQAIRPGDYVIIELGHNDNGPYDSGRARATIPGTGTDSLLVNLAGTDSQEMVYTYGEYLRRYIHEINRRGGHAILMSLTPRNAWNDADSTRITRVADTYGGWAREVAEAEGVPFIDLNAITADKYEHFGKEKVKLMFYKDRIHTSALGARVNAESAVEGILACDVLNELAATIVNPPYVFSVGTARHPGQPLTLWVGDLKGAPASTPGESYLRDNESLRSLVASERWHNIYRALEPGDVVYICYGQSNTDPFDSGSELGALPAGEEMRVCQMPSDGRYELVYPIDTYLKIIIGDILEKGATYQLVNFPENLKL